MTSFKVWLVLTAMLSSLFLLQPPPAMFVGVILLTMNFGVVILFTYWDLKWQLHKYKNRKENNKNG